MAELGAQLREDGRGTEFRVWAPNAERVQIALGGAQPRLLDLRRGERGVFEIVAEAAPAGTEYAYLLDGGAPRPDPRSRSQPHGVHGSSCVVDPRAFAWTDAGFRCPELAQLVLYELHVGTFTPQGTFAAAVAKLPHLRALGVNAVELMPIAAFPGTRNWGYDGVGLFAPQSSYGGPHGLRQLVDACHAHGLAVVLDVVYNHAGPEGCYLRDFGPYFTERYRSPWGETLNYDGPDSDEVRRFFLDNALYWLREYHVDGLRLDAIQGIFDFSARHLLAEMQTEVQAQAARLDRTAYLFAESDLNDVRVIDPETRGGFGLNAQWIDDFHHALRTLLVEERRSYFADFGRVADLQKALSDGYVYDGRYSAFRRRRHGNSSAGRPGSRFVVYSQNHDQIANASQGRRLSQLVPLETQKLAAAVVLCAPSVPLLFMGEEFHALTPFHYFVSHGDPELVEAVRAGRRAEHAAFGGETAFPDPQDEATFTACKLDWGCVERAPHAQVLAFYRALIALRRSCPALSGCNKELSRVHADEQARWIVLERRHPTGSAACAFNFGQHRARVPLALPAGEYTLELASWDSRYGGIARDLPPHGTQRVSGERPATILLPPRGAAVYVEARG